MLTVRDNEQDSEHSVGDDEVASSDVAEGGKLVGVCHVQRKSRVNAITCRRDNATRAAGQRGPRVNTGRESTRAASPRGHMAMRRETRDASQHGHVMLFNVRIWTLKNFGRSRFLLSSSHHHLPLANTLL